MDEALVERLEEAVKITLARKGYASGDHGFGNLVTLLYLHHQRQDPGGTARERLLAFYGGKHPASDEIGRLCDWYIADRRDLEELDRFLDVC